MREEFYLSYLIGGKVTPQNIKDIKNYISDNCPSLKMYIMSDYPLRKDLKEIDGPFIGYYSQYTTLKKLREFSSRDNIYLALLNEMTTCEEEDLESYLEKSKINYIRQTYSETIENLILISTWKDLEKKWHLNFSIPMNSFFRYLPSIDAFAANTENNYSSLPMINSYIIEQYLPYNISIKEMHKEIQKLYSKQFYLDYLSFY
mgnify:FL=1